MKRAMLYTKSMYVDVHMGCHAECHMLLHSVMMYIWVAQSNTSVVSGLTIRLHSALYMVGGMQRQKTIPPPSTWLVPGSVRRPSPVTAHGPLEFKNPHGETTTIVDGIVFTCARSVFQLELTLGVTFKSS